MIETLVKETHEFSFFQAVSLLEKHYQTSIDHDFEAVGENKHFHQEYIRFSVSPNLCFPKADIDSIETLSIADFDYTNIEVNFLGLHGSSSPLPTSYTEKLAGRDPEDNPVKDFFDFFHNRYVSLLYRVWKKYRYHVLYESGAKDRFSERMLHLAGLSSVIQERETVELDRAKLLSYVNQLSTRTRSPKMIAGIVAHYFTLENVEIEEWVLRRVSIAPSQRNILNQVNCILGHDLHLGQRLKDLNGKFNLHIRGIDFRQFVQFSRGGDNHEILLGLMRFILRDPMSWDLVLTVDVKTVPKNKLGHGEANRLGQTLWLGNPTSHDMSIHAIGNI
ncbi:type VI secretion system baseplate subunit TssG [Vibrio mexicanus]|uniref:type VI secretion system baseplate subunit TssG n=1 Tax=Vibrio mexicanus TaxID=1004326 RepID=UPI00063C3DFE|nr:type VI secretion system baseplate subunit TssG [Vibrio mexicanus]